ncbi:uncharacterized protein LOC134814886 [Bolinopsis microptera]|uniref:uncharacterized protein LOC134814886 n=1 Tax=Bolinopsis microptera TaxID=2820187 RepID=UPI003078F743
MYCVTNIMKTPFIHSMLSILFIMANKTKGVCQIPVSAVDLVLKKQIAPSWVASISEIPWFCKINDNQYCDTISDCLTDECGCTNSSIDVFFCPKRTGCVTFPQLCDGKNDCLDGADECLCEGFVEIQCPILNSSSICLSQREYCEKKDAISQLNYSCTFRNIEYVDCSAILDNENPINQCLNYTIIHALIDNNHGNITSLYCKTNCSDTPDFADGKWDKFCERIVLVYMGMFAQAHFSCAPESYETCPLSKLCDGELDCSNSADEAECPGRFYCSLNTSESTEWVTPDKTCDNIKHCSNGRDECDPCNSDGSANLLLSSYFLLAFTAFAGVSSIALNLRGVIRCYNNTPSTSAGKVDRLLCLQVLFFDGSMGLYNCGVVVAALVLRANGDYCLQDESWRSSTFCLVLGLTFSIASHGSLSAIALMSVVRCINCVRVYHQTKLKTIFITSAILIAINVINALIPILPLVAIQNIFRTDVFFKNFLDNPFISSSYVNMTWLNHLHETYYSNKTDLYTTVRDLNIITSKDNIFDVIDIGYYGNTRLCVHNVFKEQLSYLIYKLSYLITVSLLLVIVTLTYLIIVRQQLESRREVGDIGGGMNRQNAAAPSLALKISLMIGTQLASWLSFIGAAVYFQLVSDSPPPVLFEVLALVVLPINSILNPIFYSELYKNINSCFWRSWRGFVSRLRS